MTPPEKLRRQLSAASGLADLAFDDPRYDKWRAETGVALVEVFPDLESEPHPCVQAFLAYRIPKHFTASRDEMQPYYSNILRYQIGLLRMYLEDLEQFDR